MHREPKGIEGIEVEEHNGPDSVNYLKPRSDTEPDVSEI